MTREFPTTNDREWPTDHTREFPPVGGGGVSLFSAQITVSSGVVGADLMDFPFMVRLSHMPAGFWDNVRDDGGDIRVRNTSNDLIPIDLFRFDKKSQDGVIFIRAAQISSSVDNTWTIQSATGLSKLPTSSALGRNAVWQDYECVFLMGESGADDRTGPTTTSPVGRIMNDPDCFEIVSTSPVDLDSHQGVCFDGSYYYTVDDNRLRKWDLSWSLVLVNSDPIGSASLGSPVNHCSDPDIKNDRIYIPIQEFPDTAASPNQWLTVFEPSSLGFVEKWNVGSQNYAQYSGVAYCDSDDLLYMCAWTEGDGSTGTNVQKLFKFDPFTGNFEGVLSLSLPLHSAQGLTWWRDHFWLNGDNNDETFRITFQGEVSLGNISGAGGVFGQAISGGNYEGIGHTDEELLVLADPGATERVDTWRPFDMPIGAGGGIRSNIFAQGIEAGNRTSVTSFTFAASMIINSLTGLSQGFFSFYRALSGAPGNRPTIAYRGNTANSDGLGLWDDVNGWFQGAKHLPGVGNARRVHGVYNGSTRRLYINGNSHSVQTGITPYSADLNQFRVAWVSSHHADGCQADVGFCYLRAGELSSAWIAAEYKNLANPSSFYQIS